MQDRRVGALVVVVKVDLSGAHVEFDARRQSRRRGTTGFSVLGNCRGGEYSPECFG
jgi:hypothetical protein